MISFLNLIDLERNSYGGQKSKFPVEFFQNFSTSRFVRPCSIRIGGGQKSKKNSKNFWTIPYLTSYFTSFDVISNLIFNIDYKADALNPMYSIISTAEIKRNGHDEAQNDCQRRNSTIQTYFNEVKEYFCLIIFSQ